MIVCCLYTHLCLTCPNLHTLLKGAIDSQEKRSAYRDRIFSFQIFSQGFHDRHNWNEYHETLFFRFPSSLQSWERPPLSVHTQLDSRLLHRHSDLQDPPTLSKIPFLITTRARAVFAHCVRWVEWISFVLIVCRSGFLFITGLNGTFFVDYFWWFNILHHRQ